MAENIKLEVVTPDHEVVNEEAQIVMAPGSLGEFGVLIGHTPFMTSLKTGEVCYNDANGNRQCVCISGGFAEALPDKVTILAEAAEKCKDIDVQRAMAAKERAENRMADKGNDDIDYARARIALERAINRIRIAGGN
jgi:F-type H+-transporting ATPase subunit epsilon